ncbi:MAG: hypothetical protein AB2693_34785 [Candidatus Thiodiazotropha sp.]
MPRNSVVRLIDSPDMTLAVEWDVKQQNNNNNKADDCALTTLFEMKNRDRRKHPSTLLDG